MDKTKSTKKIILDILSLIGCLLWIPFGIAAFFTADGVPLYFKFIIGAAVSFAGMIWACAVYDGHR